MLPQDRSGSHGADFALKTGFDRGGFTGIRNDRQKLPGLHDLADGHGDGVRWNLREIGKPRLAYLLTAAGFIERNNQIRFFRLKIGRWVVKRNVAILSDSKKCNVDWLRGDGLIHAAKRLSNISLSIKQVVLHNSSFLDQLFHQHLAEAARRRDRQTNIFIQVKDLDLAPIDLRFARKMVEKYYLRCSGCGHYAGASLLMNRLANRFCRVARSGLAERLLVVEYLDLHLRSYLASSIWLHLI